MKLKKLLRIALTIITLLLISDNLLLLFLGKKAEAVLVKYEFKGGGGPKAPSYKYPVFRYKYKGDDVYFNGNWDSSYKFNEKYPIIYRPYALKRARVFSFWGIAKKPIIQYAVFLFIWIIVYRSVIYS